MPIHMCGCTTADERNGNWGCPNPKTSYEGAVLDTYERNGYDDSDFYAVVWNGEAVTDVCYASTRGWTYHNGASVDATPETEAAALAWYRARWETGENARQDEEAVTVSPGKTVRSLTTRGKNVGITGEAKWFGPVDRRYGVPIYATQRIGVQVAGERGYRFVARDRLEVVDPAPVDRAAIAEQAKTAAPANWRSAQYVGLSSALLAAI